MQDLLALATADVVRSACLVWETESGLVLIKPTGAGSHRPAH